MRFSAAGGAAGHVDDFPVLDGHDTCGNAILTGSLLVDEPVVTVCALGNRDEDVGVAIGTDLDGGYGQEQAPRDLNTIADLQKLPDIMINRGYTEDDISNILSGNWIRLFKETWS